MSKQEEDSFMNRQDLWLKNALAPSEQEITSLVHEALHSPPARITGTRFRFGWLLAGAAALVLIMLCPLLFQKAPRPPRFVTLSNASGTLELIVADTPPVEPKSRLISMVGEGSVLTLKVTNGHERYIISGGSQ
jgi:hypothetical protein